METSIATSDGLVVDLLRQNGSMSVSDMSRATSVTATAVRQRLSRLMGQGMVERDVVPSGRGRPKHRYSLTEKARRQAGNNFPDLAVVLWDEIRAVKDQEVRRGLLDRIATALAAMYRDRVHGPTLAARMEALKRLFGERRVPLDITHDFGASDGTARVAANADPLEPGPTTDASNDRTQAGSARLPMLTVTECPYPELAEKDRGICAVEKMLFAKLLDQPVRLSQCRLDGHSCCQFETN